ncbi:MAG: glycosyltransferase family 2 protein [Planctomycetes bacterium]|nr:glycosyltransferase family 2 protein [Planctomycetota bacterium]
MTDPAISLIVPTFNESRNLPVLVERVAAALQGRTFEIIVVDDDSPDRTWEVAEGLAARFPVRVFRRIGKRGLSSAVVDGFAAAKGEALAVIDADLQHDPAVLPRLVDGLARCEAAVGTRYAGSGSTGEWGGARLALSRSATWSVRRLLGVPTSDPMSGFFAIRRSLFQRIAPLLQPRGYKILLEVLHRGRVSEVHEEPYTFAGRLHGESKLGTGVLLDCAAALWELRFGAILPLRFVKYCLVGLSGVGVQLLATHALRAIPDLRTADSRLATAIAIAIAMLSNYILDNVWTFRDVRHRGGRAVAIGILRFAAICGTGAVISWSVAQGARLATDGVMNIYFASLIGIAVATVWNYVLNRQFTWRSNG